MEHLLTLGIVVLLIMVAIAIGLILGLVHRLKPPQDRRPDPHLEQLGRLRDETLKRRRETQTRLIALRKTLQQGLRGQ